MSSSTVLHPPTSESLSGERSPLLSERVTSTSSNTHHQCYPLIRQHLCLPSKAAILILLWTAVIGIVYHAVIECSLLLFSVNSIREKNVSTLASIPFAILALSMMFYPLSGFLADVCCGRFRTIMASLIIVTISIFLLFCTSLLLSLFYYKLVSPGVLTHPLLVGIRQLSYFLFVIAMLIFMFGLIGYQANFIQLGLDQLLEAPSEYLALFVHWAKWINNATATVTMPLYSLLFACNVFDINHGIKTYFEIIYFFLFAGINAVCFITMIVLLVLSARKSHWFYYEPGQHNPYKTVLKTLNYVRKHKYPLQRSAFTYCDYVIPTRFDFAKERFGGPFTTEQVEDVKSFLRILLILLVLGPIHILQVPASSIVFPLFGLHTGHHIPNSSYAQAEHEHCNWKVFMLRSNTMEWLISTLVFPLYIWYIFSFLRKRMPRILIRLGIGIILLFLGVVSILIVDVVGHSMNLNTESLNSTLFHDQCMFHARSQHGYLHYPTLNIHWSVLIPPPHSLPPAPNSSYLKAGSRCIARIMQ